MYLCIVILIERATEEGCCCNMLGEGSATAAVDSVAVPEQSAIQLIKGRS
jgi:hypothetical protein